VHPQVVLPAVVLLERAVTKLALIRSLSSVDPNVLLVIRLAAKPLVAEIAHKRVIRMDLAMRAVVAQIFVAFAACLADKRLLGRRDVTASLHGRSSDRLHRLTFPLLFLCLAMPVFVCFRCR